MKRKILLPTDFSKNSINAIHYALDMYKHDTCQFYVLNAFSMPSYDVDSLQMINFDLNIFTARKKEINEELIVFIKKIIKDKKIDETHSFDTIAIHENPLLAIKKTIEDYDIDLVIMGTKGETGSQNILYGSLAIQVMEKSRNTPVLVVPENANFSDLNEIVFPTSYKTHFKRRELHYLNEIAERSSASIRILHIANEDQLTEDQRRHKNMLNECFEEVIHTFHSMKNVDKVKAIDHFVEDRGIDLIAFINKKHRFFENIFNRPLVKSITYQIKVPVLVMHDLRN